MNIHTAAVWVGIMKARVLRVCAWCVCMCVCVCVCIIALAMTLLVWAGRKLLWLLMQVWICLFAAVQVQFDPQNYIVTEGNVVNMTLVTNTSDYMFNFTVTLQNMDGSAAGESFNWNFTSQEHLRVIITIYLPFTTAGSDYATGPYHVIFTAGQMSATLMVFTMDDNSTELSENFRVMIISIDQPSAVEIGSSYMSSITIEDNDPGVCAQLKVLCICVFCVWVYNIIGCDKWLVYRDVIHMSLELEKHEECTYCIYACVHEYTYGSSVGGYDGG